MGRLVTRAGETPEEWGHCTRGRVRMGDNPDSCTRWTGRDETRRSAGVECAWEQGLPGGAAVRADEAVVQRGGTHRNWWLAGCRAWRGRRRRKREDAKLQGERTWAGGGATGGRWGAVHSGIWEVFHSRQTGFAFPEGDLDGVPAGNEDQELHLWRWAASSTWSTWGEQRSWPHRPGWPRVGAGRGMTDWEVGVPKDRRRAAGRGWLTMPEAGSLAKWL